MYGKYLAPWTLTVSMAARRIGDTGIFTTRGMRLLRLPTVYQHDSHSLDASHNPYQRRMRSFRALADLSCLPPGLSGCRCVILIAWNGAIKEGADNMMGRISKQDLSKERFW
jgi:hypothetical protein